MLNDKTVLITGGTGSFGRKFVEVALRDYKPRKVIVLSRDELKQHEMNQKFPAGPDKVMRYFLGDVRDPDRLYRAFREVDLVVHAAALKQVPACEYNPFEAIKTNILGTKNVIDAAIARKVPKVMAISTDKAVNPINLYGATKLCAEKMVIQANSYSFEGGSRFSACRYGNVIGSRGSVVPLFRKQAEQGCITVTDRRMTRFWITLEQGVRFVLNCIERMQGGEIFVPDIPSCSIMDLAHLLAPACKVQEIGIRPGEKLHEVLISTDESRQALRLADMFLIQPSFPWWRPSEDLQGQPLPEGFCFASNQNSRHLESDELNSMLEDC
ncbi:MAG: UDP-N-acetylglucosamine 4,6-dehydratase (inverting) [Desulfarculus sp.]|nr:UDP-N-acetylglucosamine 4,6-dehydratase (inverting) [Desulfarculus sp.]